MSLEIKISSVKKVLLIDTWHFVKAGSFDIDSYEFLEGEKVLLGGGADKLVSSHGVTFRDACKIDCQIYDEVISCPMSSIVAISQR